MTQEKVSVIVPIYNVKDYLERCVESLLKQTYPNLEIILVDDCSTDGGEVLAQQYAERYPNICRFIQQEQKKRASGSRNTGISASTGEWIAFMDSDDWVTEDYISSMYETAQKEKAELVVNCSRYIIDDQGKKYVWDPCPKLSSLDTVHQKVALLPFSPIGKLYRKSLFVRTNILYPEDIWRCEDLSAVIPLITYAEKIAVMHRPTYYYFQRSSSLSNTNYKNVDVSFYPKTVDRMMQLSNQGFEKELEYRAITELMYGMVMIMVRSGRSKKEISDQIDSFDAQFPHWKKNDYLEQLVKGKRIFIFFAAHKKIGILKLLMWLWDKKNS
jgi:glycosyltransferase EpsH